MAKERTREEARQERRRSEEAARRLQEFHAAANDWRGRCRLCGEELEGSIEDLKGHVCGT